MNKINVLKPKYRTDWYSNELVTLPIHLNLKKSDCMRVEEVIKENYNE